MDTLEKLRIHFVYCALILTLVIIAIATDRWTLQPKFTEFLSNAATMTSLVLGLVAIFYSFVANDGLSKSLGGIGAVSEEVRATREQITQQVAQSGQTTKSTERSAGLIEKASSDISANLTTLSATLAAIKDHTEALHGSLGGLPTRIDQLETKLLDATKSLGTKAVAAPAPLIRSQGADAALVKRFLEISALASNLLTYACVLAERKKKDLDLAEFCTAIDSKLDSWLSGFLSCMAALQLVVTSEKAGQFRHYEVSGVHPILVETTREYFVSYIQRIYKDKKPETYERWLAALNNVEKLFE